MNRVKEWVDLIFAMDAYHSEHKGTLRRGQAWMNYLYTNHRDLHDLLDQTEADCFYRDDLVDKAAAKLYEKFNSEEQN